MIFRRACTPAAFPPWGARPGETSEPRGDTARAQARPAPRKALRRKWPRPFGRERRGGFTLLELMLVLSMFVVMGAVAYPALQGPLAAQRLHSAAKQLRADLSRLRLKAIESGEPQQFRYVPGENKYRVGADELLSPPTDAGGDPGSGSRLSEGGHKARAPLGDGPTLKSRFRQFALGEPIAFAEPDESEVTENLPGEPLAPASVEQRDSASGDELGGENWSSPVLFQPDGSSSGASFLIENPQGKRMWIAVHALTGTVSIGEAEPREETYAP